MSEAVEFQQYSNKAFITGNTLRYLNNTHKVKKKRLSVDIIITTCSMLMVLLGCLTSIKRILRDWNTFHLTLRIHIHRVQKVLMESVHCLYFSLCFSVYTNTQSLPCSSKGYSQVLIVDPQHQKPVYLLHFILWVLTNFFSFSVPTCCNHV